MYAITHAAPAVPRAPSPVLQPERAGTRPVPVDLFNAPSPREADDGSRGLMEAIEEGDAALRRHMAFPLGTVLPCPGSELPATPVQELVHALDCNVPERTGNARALITVLEPLREQLGRRVAEDLQTWLKETTTPFTLNPELLKYQVLYAGLAHVLRRLPLSEMPHAQRLRIGEVLHEAGGNPAALQGWLGLNEDDLQGDYSTALLNLMLPREEQGSLGFERPCSVAMREQRAHVWQWVAMVNRRFGHRDNQLAALDPSVPRRNRRVRQLQNLANAPEAQREGIKVQLP
ncbi:hypothetical protein [Stenotrophomonas oahuensis]|uniref:Uncharacterized protein n=1 Tax=Stenotrophomonas oahuensis TaxID=3003271 RepID=A0ABY9YJR5_9GAMM|nr:hypothetical protein [Stenotrophomonas sp. A5586]WNH50866.1 hypothetical protein PDM29_10715 [Stenotrophomonas sp. A5586]